MVTTPAGADHLLRMNGFPAPRPLQLALLDDHEIVRRGTALHLAGDRRFTIVASHTHSDDLINSLRYARVDVAIIDLTLAPGDRDGAELVALLREQFPRMPLLAFATHLPTTNLNHLIGTGLSGFVSKAEPLHALSDAILRVAQGLTRAAGFHPGHRAPRAHPQRARGPGPAVGGIHPVRDRPASPSQHQDRQYAEDRRVTQAWTAQRH